MQRGIVTKLSVYEDRLFAMSQKSNGSNLDTVAFNLTLLSELSPEITQEVLAIFNRVRRLRSK